MSYNKELAFHLRQRGTPEGDVAAILAEVRAATPTDEAATAEFGPAADYAGRFPQRASSRSLGRVIVSVATLLAIAYAIIKLIAFPYFGVTLLDGTGPIHLWPALVIVALGLVIGFLVDRYRHLPKQPIR